MEKKENYVKTGFEIKLKGNYRRIMRFIYQIENDLKLNIDSLRLCRLKDADFHKMDRVEACLGINSIEMKDAKEREASTLFDLREQYLSSGSRGAAPMPKKIARNPFKEPKEAQRAEALQEKMHNVLKNLSIVGIMDFNNNKRALINNKFVKEGDLLENQIVVLKINKETVTLGFRNREYTLRMERNPVSLKQNSRRLIHE